MLEVSKDMEMEEVVGEEYIGREINKSGSI